MDLKLEAAKYIHTAAATPNFELNELQWIASDPAPCILHLRLFADVQSPGLGAPFSCRVERESTLLHSEAIDPGLHILGIHDTASECSFWLDSSCIYTRTPLTDRSFRQSSTVTVWDGTDYRRVAEWFRVIADGEIHSDEFDEWPGEPPRWIGASQYIGTLGALWAMSVSGAAIFRVYGGPGNVVVALKPAVGDYTVAYPGEAAGWTTNIFEFDATAARTVAIAHGFFNADSPQISDLSSSCVGLVGRPACLVRKPTGQLILGVSSQGPSFFTSGDNGKTWG